MNAFLDSSLLPFAALAAVLVTFASVPAPAVAAEPAKLGSRIFTWESLTARPTPLGARREVANQPTATLERFQSHITTLNPGKASHPPHQHSLEEMILVKEGTLDVTINGETQRAGPGSVLFYASNDFHHVTNVGDAPATYIVLNFGTAATATAPAQPAARTAPATALRSGVHEWSALPVKATKTGARRDVFNSPTVTCINLSCHATTVNAGDASHGAHRHPDEEVVIVKEGLVEVLVNGTTQRCGPGSVCFFASNDEHGMRNVGDTAATYYVIRVVSAATPKSAAPARK